TPVGAFPANCPEDMSCPFKMVLLGWPFSNAVTSFGSRLSPETRSETFIIGVDIRVSLLVRQIWYREKGSCDTDDDHPRRPRARRPRARRPRLRVCTRRLHLQLLAQPVPRPGLRPWASVPLPPRGLQRAAAYRYRTTRTPTYVLPFCGPRPHQAR